MSSVPPITLPCHGTGGSVEFSIDDDGDLCIDVDGDHRVMSWLNPADSSKLAVWMNCHAAGLPAD